MNVPSIETLLLYYRARYYDPTISRFFSEDPAKHAAGMDFYSYVENTPVNLIDPSGLCPWEVHYRDLNHSRTLGRFGLYHFFFYNTQTGQALGLGPAPVTILVPQRGPLGDLLGAAISKALPIVVTVPGQWETQESAESTLVPVPDWLCNCVDRKVKNPGNPPDYNTWEGQIDLTKPNKRNCLGWAGNLLQDCYNEEYPKR